MNILIYEPLPDIRRGKIASALARNLIRAGDNVLVLLERKLIYTERFQLTDRGVLDNAFPICFYFDGLPVRFIDIEQSVYEDVREVNLVNKLQQVSQQRHNALAKVLADFDPDLMVLWNGNHNYQTDIVETVRNLGFKGQLLFTELAWLPQKDHFYFDPKGTNGNSTLSNLVFPPLNNEQGKQIKQWLNEFQLGFTEKSQPDTVLIPLQLDNDTSITHFSPYQSMAEFMLVLDRWLPQHFRVIIRPHPLNRKSIKKIMPPRFEMDPHLELKDSLAVVEYVVGINSTSLIEALAYGKKVIAFGTGIFSSSESIYQVPNPGIPFTEFRPNEERILSFLHFLVFRKQIAFNKLYGHDHIYLKQKMLIELQNFSSSSSRDILVPKLTSNVLERITAWVFCILLISKQSMNLYFRRGFYRVSRYLPVSLNKFLCERIVNR